MIGPAMKDCRAYLEKLRKDAAECAHVRDKAPDCAKREMFDRLSNHPRKPGVGSVAVCKDLEVINV